MLKIIENDPWLTPYTGAIEGRHDHALWRESQLTGGKMSLKDFASGYLYYGLQRTESGWVFREWAPNATEIFLIGDFSGWQEQERFRLQRINDAGDWELRIPLGMIGHGQHYKMRVKWNGGQGDRIPAWCRRVVQDDQSKIFSAQVWDPGKDYIFKHKDFKPKQDPLLIYECHVGMAQEREGVGTYIEFKDNVLPRVKAAGYNCIQVMAIQEHPYYGSFGYHVSSFFAPSSRFGPPKNSRS